MTNKAYVAIPGRTRAIDKAKASLDEIEALAASYEPNIAKALLTALQKQSDDLDLDELASALATGNLGKVLDMLSMQLGGVADALQDAVWAGGAMAAESIAVGGTMFHFHRLNPVLTDWLQTYSLGLIREINEGTKTAIRNQLVDGMRAGRGPRAQARHIKSVVGLTDRQANAVANFRKELEGFHLKRTAGGWKLGGKIDRVNNGQVFKPGKDGKPKDGIMERRLRDYRYDGQLLRALQDKKPLTPAQIDKMVAAYGRKYRRYRAETIARTESMRALNMGAQEGWRQAVMENKVVETLVRRTWKVARDERLCETCSPVPGLNKKGVGLGVPFVTPKGPVMLPPLHPDCRCHVFIRQLEPGQVTL